MVETQRGLVILTLGDLIERSLDSLAAERKRLVQQAQGGRLSADAMRTPTFTLSNIGTGHVDFFTAIISPPQVAILSVGSIQPRPLVLNSQLVVRPSVNLVLGADHRAIDGREAAGFLECLKAHLESGTFG